MLSYTTQSPARVLHYRITHSFQFTNTGQFPNKPPTVSYYALTWQFPTTPPPGSFPLHPHLAVSHYTPTWQFPTTPHLAVSNYTPPGSFSLHLHLAASYFTPTWQFPTTPHLEVCHYTPTWQFSTPPDLQIALSSLTQCQAGQVTVSLQPLSLANVTIR